MEEDKELESIKKELRISSLYIGCVELLNLPLTKDQVAKIIVEIISASMGLIVSLCSTDFISKMTNAQMMSILGNQLFTLLEEEHGIPLMAAQKKHIQDIKENALTNLREHESEDPMEQEYIDKVIIPRMEKYPDKEEENTNEISND